LEESKSFTDHNLLSCCNVPGICVEIIQIDLDLGFQFQPHEGEPFGRETITAVEAALVPFDSAEGRPGIIRDCVQTTAKWDAARGRRAILMIVGLVDVRVEVEVLTNKSVCIASLLLGLDGEFTSCM
jgi:hypothetical protein